MAPFDRLATLTASIKRNQAVDGEFKRGVKTAVTGTFACTPIDPITPELARQMALESPHEVVETFADNDVDIREGDIVVVGSDEYEVQAVEDWNWRSTTYRRVLMHDRKQSG